MKKLIGIALVLLSAVGCSSCKDGSNWYLGHAGGYQYEECKKGCCEAEDPKTCKCSEKCSCHANHTPETVVIQKKK